MRKFIIPIIMPFVAAVTAAARPGPTPAGRIQTQNHPFTQKSLGPKGYLKGDQIGGCCTLLGTVVRVETLESKLISESKIETIDTFTINGFKPGTAYNLVLMHPRYKSPLKLEKVVSGNWINFKSP